MNTFLFAWNPNKWDWKTLEERIEEITLTGKTTEMWSVRSFKKINPGDRAFLVRLGKVPKGVIASGIVTTPPSLSPHWSGEGKSVNRVIIEFDTILNADTEPILDLATLQDSKSLGSYNWTPQASGIKIPQDLVDELNVLWYSLSRNIGANTRGDVQVFDGNKYFEGSPRLVLTKRHERNPEARKRCIEHFGAICVCCNLDFEITYGFIGKGFIHVHHLERISDVGRNYEVDPIKDLRPVCPNCHAMIHRQSPPLTINEIKEILIDNK